MDMTTDTKDVKSDNALVSSAKEDAGAEKKILKSNQGIPEGWDNQPEVVTNEGEQKSEESKAESDSVVSALEKEKARIAEKREKLLAELKEKRGENKQLKAELSEDDSSVVETTEEPAEIATEDEGWKRVERIIDTKLESTKNRDEFYSAKPDFYMGEDGNKNRHLIEQYVKVHFKEPSNNAREMAHSYIFGDIEREMLKSETKRETAGKMMSADIATLGSDKGKSSLSTPQKEKRRIIPKNQDIKDWY